MSSLLNASWAAWPVKIAAVLVSLAYPFAVYWGLQHWGARGLVLVLCVPLLLRLLWRRKGDGALLPALSMAVIVAVVWLTGWSGAVLYQPVAVNAVLFSTFWVSLRRPPSMIERFARLQEPDLPPEAVVYCAKVTRVWCGFFVLNGVLSLFTALYGDLALWTLYNGLISYGLIGLLFGVEWLVRLRFKRRLKQEPNS
ncbi:COG4648 family protein [Acanthopleuribacter pedis]|uniref:DNA gyrase subunit B n=1 Tax=Acanthopleuribacter pedis TaxID=442870 RepID=A0A8J7QEB7_9BACT|nr:hypothetical protein [Acanthopleuribacter pedis]MBO1323022.1 hypothetical protein [Acanthopleuribacter pedis]